MHDPEAIPATASQFLIGKIQVDRTGRFVGISSTGDTLACFLGGQDIRGGGGGGAVVATFTKADADF